MTFAHFLHQSRLHTQCWVLLALLLHKIARDESHMRPITGTIHRCSPYFFHPKKKMRKGSRGVYGLEQLTDIEIAPRQHQHHRPPGKLFAVAQQGGHRRYPSTFDNHGVLGDE